MTSARFQLRVRRTLRITLAWLFVGLVTVLFEQSLLERYGLEVGVEGALLDHAWRYLLAGLAGGGTYIFLLRDRLRAYPFLQAFGMVAALMLFIVGITHAVMPAINDPDALPAQRLFSLQFLGVYLYWTLLMGGTMLIVRINDQYSGGGLAYLAGRYFKPRSELRIFMFLDMRSSTSIAEKLGHVRYFKLLNDVFADITDPVVDSRGEIYQYVGDEMSMSWPLRKGIASHRCIDCFFRIQEKLKRRSAYYKSEYGISPVFKAGLHYGNVTTGEVGLVKKELIFSGDVVNTAARIQNSCNAHGVDILISRELLDVLRLPKDKFRVREIGEIGLKGKKNAVGLWTLEPIAP